MNDFDAAKEDDITLLKVLGSKALQKDGRHEDAYVSSLANALMTVFLKHKVARLRCVGMSAINNADNAIALAMREATKNNLDLVEKKEFIKVDFGGEVKTGIVKIIFENGQKP